MDEQWAWVVVLVAAAVGETVVLLHPPLSSAGVPMGMERERQQIDRTLTDGAGGGRERLRAARSE